MLQQPAYSRVFDAVEGGPCWRCDTDEPTTDLGLCKRCLDILRDPGHLHPPSHVERRPVRDGPLLRGTILAPAFPKIGISAADIGEGLLDVLRPLCEALTAIAMRARR